MIALLTVAESAHEVKRNLDGLSCILGAIAFAAVVAMSGKKKR